MRKITLALLATTVLAFGHGSVTPQAIDTKNLKPLGAEWLEENPYKGDEAAIKLGKYAYSENCARCHGLDAVSGGIAPDLRALDDGIDGVVCLLDVSPCISSAVRRLSDVYSDLQRNDVNIILISS